ncbi:MAG: FG-GAP repeat protein, partial [Phycisphaerales bacterium]
AHQKISDTEGGFTGILNNEDWFGVSAASLGDHDGDGVGDLAVGACLDGDGGYRRGAVWVLFLDGLPACPADLNGDGQVNIDDLFEVLGHWGVCGDPNDCPWDLAGPNNGPPDGKVNIDDLFAVLGAWGPCP